MAEVRSKTAEVILGIKKCPWACDQCQRSGQVEIFIGDDVGMQNALSVANAHSVVSPNCRNVFIHFTDLGIMISSHSEFAV